MNEQIMFLEKKLEFETDPYDLFQALSKGEKIIVIDARHPEAYEEEHIPGAIYLNHRDINEETTKGFDKDAFYVIYCDGIGCNASTKGALKMCRLGFKHIKELIGGIRWWKQDGFATDGEKAFAGATAGCAC